MLMNMFRWIYVLFKEHTGIDLPKVNKKDESVSTAKETLKQHHL